MKTCEIYLVEEAEDMLDRLIVTGLYGSTRQMVAEALVLDQLKHLAATPGFAPVLFPREGEAPAADDDAVAGMLARHEEAYARLPEVAEPMAIPPDHNADDPGCNCSYCIPF